MDIVYNPIEVKVRRWSGGWDLVIDESNATSVAHLKDAQEQVRDYLDTIEPEIDHSSIEVILDVELDGFQEQIKKAQRDSELAALAQERAAKQIRDVAHELKARGIAAEDAAVILGVSRARVYQLLSAS